MAYHFVGIKGTGMAALAEILYDEQKEVRGSDIEKYIFTQDGLEERGIEILPFDKENIKPNDTVIVGLSFGSDHPEVKAAMSDPSVQVYYYNDYLGHLLERYTSICVAGTHGKSTTTGIIASVLGRYEKTGFLIGDGHGHMPKDAKNFVLESCEFKRHFLAYHPDYAIITNMELDHIDYYKDMDDYIDAFQSFVNQIKKKAVICGDDPYLTKLSYPIPHITYGLHEGNDYQAKNVHQGPDGITYDVYFQNKLLHHVKLPGIGYPFLINSLGVFALAHTLGMDPDEIVAGLLEYKGIARRFVSEEVNGSVLIDDYAHHPTAISFMIEAARNRYPDKKIVALYKPDRYSRLQYFLDRFAQSLNTADQVCLLDFPKNAVREDDTITVTIQDLLDRCPNAKLLEIDDQSARELKDMGPAVYVFMSSKDIYLLKDKLKEIL
ncbi:UDP-N-acetylmuramate-alanine ligase [Firmicutes bacterium M10-2]|nr:UDP-N-acetylmuramate-alanine ligase [Firmicutes bacterium M10-2]